MSNDDAMCSAYGLRIGSVFNLNLQHNFYAISTAVCILCQYEAFEYIIIYIILLVGLSVQTLTGWEIGGYGEIPLGFSYL